MRRFDASTIGRLEGVVTLAYVLPKHEKEGYIVDIIKSISETEGINELIDYLRVRLRMSLSPESMKSLVKVLSRRLKMPHGWVRNLSLVEAIDATIEGTMLNPVVIIPEAFYSDGTLYQVMGLSPATLTKGRGAGTLRYARLGNLMLYKGAWILDWLESEASTGPDKRNRSRSGKNGVTH